MKLRTVGYLTNYHVLICRKAEECLTIERLIEKIRQTPTPTTEEGVEIYKKFHNFQTGPRFGGYTDEQKLKTVQDNLEILDFFGISYPLPPKEITHLFAN